MRLKGFFFPLYMQNQCFQHHLLKSPSFLYSVAFVKINCLYMCELISGLCSVLLINLSVFKAILHCLDHCKTSLEVCLVNSSYIGLFQICLSSQGNSPAPPEISLLQSGLEIFSALKLNNCSAEFVYFLYLKDHSPASSDIHCLKTDISQNLFRFFFSCFKWEETSYLFTLFCPEAQICIYFIQVSIFSINFTGCFRYYNIDF